MTDTPLFDPADLEPLLAEGWLALTPNRRLASRIRAAVVQREAARGRAVVPTPAVLALADWLERLWAQHCFDDPDSDELWLLDADQERALWQRVVEESDAGARLLRPAEAAQQAQQAWRTLALWRQLPLRREIAAEFDATEESRIFRDWLAEFERRCTALGAIAQAERDRRLLQAVEQGQLSLPSTLVTVAFDELAPLHRALFDRIPGWRELPAPARNRQASMIGCDDFATQIRRAARWAKQRLEVVPSAPVAIVVPQLAQQRATVERILRDLFEPEHAAPHGPHRPPPFNISAGAALTDVPLVATALQLLGLGGREQSREPLLALLDAPFHDFCGPVDAIARAVDALCRLRSERISSAQLRVIAATVAEAFPGWSLSGRLQQLHDIARRERWSQLRLTPGQWREPFETVLQLFGWPGARSLDSIEYQQLQQWRRALDDFSRLDVVLGPVGFDAALAALRELLAARLFQPETPDAPLQVLGLLEAAGLQFDGLWLCEMGEDLWPQAAAPNPLLPRDLQRRLAMPHCDATREQQFASRLTQSLLASSREIVVCYQCQRDDVARRPSPLFGELPSLDAVLDEPAFAPALALEPFAPGAAPALNPQARARGGSGILASQSACPFQAFARHRLGGRSLDDVVEGLDHSERGQLLHDALEMIWRELGDSQALAACDDERLRALVDSAATAAVTALRQRIPARLGARFAELEQQRLAALLLRWLELERERPPFAIAALEQSRELTLGELTLQLRVDRIDRLPDGRQLIIDYKSGNLLSPSAWTGERPEQPQLPLYGTALESEQPGSVAGLLFAQIRADKQRLIGLGDLDLERHHVRPGEHPWPQQLDDWRAALLMLADEYVGGCADVAPASNKSCDYCDLADVCRIDADTLLETVVDGDDDAQEGEA